MPKAKGLFFTDLDGTGVEKLPKWYPANWIKYPLDIQPGFKAFLDGVIDTEVELDSIVSVRPDIWPRRVVTAWTVGKYGLDAYFKDVILTGSEAKKAAVIVASADAHHTQSIGMVDDRLRIANSLVHTLEMRDARSSMRESEMQPMLQVSLGIVPGRHSAEDPTQWLDYISRSAEKTGGLPIEAQAFADGLVIPGKDYVLSIVKVPEYTFEEGQIFGNQIVALADGWGVEN